MADTFEGNGEYSNYGDGSDFKRNVDVKCSDDENDEISPNEKASDYIKELLSERVQIDRKYIHADRLLDQEIINIKQSGKLPPKENRYVDIYREKQIKVNVKVLVPLKEHPKFNFVGKLLGPKGNSMKRLQEETMCKMAVLGRGSMKDRKKEEEFRNSLDPKYAHLNDELHVEISALAPPAEAHARVAFALAEVRKYLIPDNNDIIRREQMRELISDGTLPPEAAEDLRPPPPYLKRPSSSSSGPGYQPYRTPAPQQSPISGRTVMPAKQKIMSILDRARNSMEESYGMPQPSRMNHYDEPIYEPPSYEYGYNAPPAPPTQSSRARYEPPEYEPAEYRRDYYRSSPTYPPVKSTAAPPQRPGSSWKGSSSSYQHHHSSSLMRGGGAGGGSGLEDHHHHHHHDSSSSKHHLHHSHGGGRDPAARYRSSPYSRPK